MKKTVLFLFAIVALMAACKTNVESKEEVITNDTTVVDTLSVDSMVVDTLSVDTIKTK